eukprot:198910_1
MVHMNTKCNHTYITTTYTDNSIIILLLISFIQYSISQTCCGCTIPLPDLCNDSQCALQICENDIEFTSCCTTSWEQKCADKAQEICPIQSTTTNIPSVSPISFPQGSCCSCTTETISTGCSTDQECEDKICDELIDPLCCQFEWDSNCVAIAEHICNNITTTTTTTETPTQLPSFTTINPTDNPIDSPEPTPPPGLIIITTLSPTNTPISTPLDLCCACTIVNDTALTPGCAADPQCENNICASDTYCCDTDWDIGCATKAQNICINSTTSDSPTDQPTESPLSIIPTLPPIIIIPTSQSPTTLLPSLSPTDQLCCDCTTPFQKCPDDECKVLVCDFPLASCCSDPPATWWEQKCADKAQEICPLPPPSNITTTIIPTISPTFIPQGLCCSCTTADINPGCNNDQEC